MITFEILHLDIFTQIFFGLSITYSSITRKYDVKTFPLIENLFDFTLMPIFCGQIL